ncbi:PDR/VanB family oxidoreductase [Pusillimonas noertemannii]|uniref:Vanillate O-demethylase ferredoxin subunit n=1 Tax=Pusillimonas noertemannii TaxID=305977 RepID=A0A2U1CLI2_9BURK|nr:PDR/VanB family oxidoreductase [Pusillimonas noertemannii]NYT69378.1 oxidoreductase [Pusillimonas noertemannii]PVY61844.1 vanillate O-demethylase ferredoxin subunit [Pusillimonas noertemannii]TFL09772.1 oxidoreductase [Pusillimonas noertemannii]
MSQLTVKVVNKVQEAEEIVSLELASVDGKPLPSFSAGAHIDVHIRDGLIRQYSLLNDSAEQHRYVIGVLRDPESRGGSIAVHDDINQGDTIQISSPKNHFELVQAKRTLLFAGGIGVTPILCMARRLSHIGADFEMHYNSRSPERMAFREAISNAAFADKVHFHFDNGEDSQKLDLAPLLANPQADTHLYVCGPTGYIDFVVNTAKQAGWPSDHVHLEYFGAAEVDTSGDTSFEVKIASTGQVFAIPADKPITQVLDEAGVFIPVSCEEGVCGTCLTRVLEGTPDHRDLYLTDAEHEANDQFTPCCSRSKSPLLVLDI